MELHKACDSGNAFLVHSLLKRGVCTTVTDPNQNDSTVLIKAVRANHVDVVIVLMLSKKIHVSTFDMQGICSYSKYETTE